MAEDNKHRFYELLDEFETAMLVTLDRETSRLHSRPMHIAKACHETGRVWFFTGRDSNLVSEINNDDRVLLTFQKERSAYISLGGQAEVVHDRGKVAELWKEPFKVWFPEGKEDPNIALVCVQPIDAEYWDNEGGNKIQYAFQAAKAYATGTTPQVQNQFGHVEFQNR